MRMQIIIPNYHPSRLNQSIGRHWSVKAKLKKTDRQMIAAYCQGVPKATGKRRVTMTLVFGKGGRFCDPDSVWKGALDGLVHAGMLVDDNYANVELMPVVMLRGEKKTIIELEDI